MHAPVRTPQVVRAGQHHVVMDGAHSEASAQCLATTLRQVFPDQPVALVLAMAEDKEHRRCIAQLRAMAPKVVVFTTVPIAGSYQRACPPGDDQGHRSRCRVLLLLADL